MNPPDINISEILNQSPDLIKVPCKTCGTEIRIFSKHASYGGMCQKCIEATVKPRIVNTLEAGWEKICPSLYRDTESNMLPCPDLSAKALEWERDRYSNKPGLNLWGFPRTGKTRTMFLLLKREHFRGVKVCFFGPSEFSQECEKRAWNTAGWIQKLSKIDIIAFDDVDKCKMTKPQEDKFFALIDSRFRNRLPMFFTGNSNGSTLETLFKNGSAIIGRIRDYCTSIHFPEQKTLPL